ncbi:MAG: hypothetical protein ABIO45_00015 [Burkholderiaceae bacterium]
MQTRQTHILGWLFRVALFAAAASLAVYIPFKYATQMHAVTGFYAFIFPFSALLAAAGIVVAVKPERACDCGPTVRSGIAALSVLWLATGMLCVSALADTVMSHPLRGSMATFQMTAQHIFLSLSLIAFAWLPRRMAAALGGEVVSPREPVPGATPARAA